MESGSSTDDTTMIPPGLSKSMQVSSSMAMAIANFKPSSREVISGIAPHVFDERRKKRRKSLRSSRPVRCHDPGKGSASSSSPLRCSAVIAWDNGSMMILESGHHPNVKESSLNENQHVSGVPIQQSPSELEPQLDTEKSAWRSTLLRTIVIKLRPSKRRKL